MALPGLPKVSISSSWWPIARKVIILHWLWMIFYVFVARKGASQNPTDFMAWSWAKASSAAHWLYVAVAK